MSKPDYTLTGDNRILRNGEPTGYSVGRGAYVGTTDDRADGWYVERDDGPVQRFGRGHRTRLLALQAFALDDERLRGDADPVQADRDFIANATLAQAVAEGWTELAPPHFGIRAYEHPKYGEDGPVITFNIRDGSLFDTFINLDDAEAFFDE
jgi:hypothetical protein